MLASALHMPVFLIADEATDVHYTLHASVTYLHIADAACVKGHYTELNWFKPVCAWGKCMYALNHVIAAPFEYAWIFEDDCRFGSPAALRTFVETYKTNTSQLLATYVEPYHAHTDWWNWKYARNYFPETPQHELWRSFNAYMRIGKTLLRESDNEIKRKKKGAFLEVFFINLCVSANLSVHCMSEMHPYTDFKTSAEFEELVARDDPAVAHPFKNMGENKRVLRATVNGDA